MKDYFTFRMNKDMGFSYDCKGGLISILYPFILIAGLLVAIITYPVFLFMWGWKIITQDCTKKKRRTA